MRNLLIIAILIGGAFFAGWFTIERDGDRTRIEINRTEIGDDLSDLKQKGREFLDERRNDRQADDRGLYEDQGLQSNGFGGEGYRESQEFSDSADTPAYYDQRPFNSAERFGNSADRFSSGYDDRR